jgi:hypothetical protein
LKAVLSSDEYYKICGDNHAAWIRHLYASLLGPETVSSGAERRLGKLCDDDRTYRQAVVDHLLTSTQYRIRLVQTCYTNCLGREPLPHEVVHWLGVLQRGASLESLEAQFLASEEYFNRQGGSNRQWLDAVCKYLLATISAQDDGSYLETLEGQKVTRVEIATAILEGMEYRDQVTESICAQYLGRSARPDEATRCLTTPNGETFRTSPPSPWRRGLMRFFGSRRAERARRR